MKAHVHLVNYALEKGLVVSVWDGEEWQVSKSSDAKEIISAIESVEVAEPRIWRMVDGKRVFVADVTVTPHGVDDAETVADHTVTAFMDEWSEAYRDALESETQKKDTPL